MKPTLPILLAILAAPASASAQARMSATYITAEEVQEINALPGVDRQIVSVDIGKLNLAVGVIHRGATGGAGGRGRAGGGGAVPQDQRCGVEVADPPTPVATGIAHDHQTETYIVISGAGTLVTGGYIANGRKSAADGPVTTTLNGPSCSGAIAGADVVRRDVKEGDIIVIPAGVPHGWAAIPDHVDYLSVRPDPDRVLPDDYVNPALRGR